MLQARPQSAARPPSIPSRSAPPRPWRALITIRSPLILHWATAASPSSSIQRRANPNAGARSTNFSTCHGRVVYSAARYPPRPRSHQAHGALSGRRIDSGKHTADRQVPEPFAVRIVDMATPSEPLQASPENRRLLRLRRRREPVADTQFVPTANQFLTAPLSVPRAGWR